METKPAWVDEALAKLQPKMAKVVARSQGIIPYTSDENGRFIDKLKTDPTWWTNGFWGAELWQMYHLTGDETYKTGAQWVEAQLDPNLMQAQNLDHDNGFKWLLTAVLDYKLTGSSASFNRAHLAADNLAGRFNLSGRFIRAWNNWGGQDRAGVAIIDCLMNLPLLYWASDALKDPRYKQIALAHAHTADQYFVRGDGSVKHIIHLDPNTGAYLFSEGGQGYAHGSSWTRGQAWGLYGFALSFKHTGEQGFLDTAKSIANYFIANIPADGLIPVDFRAPKDPKWLDDIAAAAAASGMIEIADLLDAADLDRQVYLGAAKRLLQALLKTEVDWNDAHDYLLKHCGASYHEKQHNYPIMYGDYFFIEALLKLAHQAVAAW